MFKKTGKTTTLGVVNPPKETSKEAEVQTQPAQDDKNKSQENSR